MSQARFLPVKWVCGLSARLIQHTYQLGHKYSALLTGLGPPEWCLGGYNLSGRAQVGSPFKETLSPRPVLAGGTCLPRHLRKW